MAATRLALVQARIRAWNQANPRAQIDPRAAIAVASTEGLGGGIGDGGHAFGPWQLNDAGGVITGRFKGWSPEQINAWAWTPAGIDEALRHIASVSGGMSGAEAVNNIVRRFERPADPDSEVRRATGSLGLTPTTGPVPNQGPQTIPRENGSPPAPAATGEDTSARDLALSLLAQTQHRAFTPPPAPLGSLLAPIVHQDTSEPLLPPTAHAVELGLLHAQDSAQGFTSPGFARWLHQADGLHLAPSLYGQLTAGREASGPPQARDLLFFGHGAPTHMGISTGGGQFVHGTNAGRTIQVSSLGNPAYSPYLMSVRNVL